MAEEEGVKMDFDVKVFVDSFRKSLEIREIVKTKKINLNDEQVKDVAITLFINSMRNISERIKDKQKNQNKDYF